MKKLEINKITRIEVQEVAEFGAYASDQEAEERAQLYLDNVTI